MDKVVREAVAAFKAHLKAGGEPTRDAFQAYYNRADWKSRATFAEIKKAAGYRPPSVADKALAEYAEIARRLQHKPTIIDLGSPLRIRLSQYIGDLAKVDRLARKKYPDLYGNRLTVEDFSEVRPKAQRFLVTTAVGSSPIHEGFWASLQTYAKHINAQIVAMACADPAHTRSQGLGTFDPRLQGVLTTDDIQLNSNVMLGGKLQLGAKQIDPVTGLDRISHKEGTFIFASPKQRLKTIAVGAGKFPHMLASTGACTLPRYNTDLYLSQRTAYLAEVDHKIGCIVVEIVDDRLFHFRRIEAEPDGSFCDLWNRVTPKKVERAKVRAVTPGDWHTGLTQPEVRDAVADMLKTLSPQWLPIHDVMDSNTINPHEIKKSVFRGRKAAGLHGELGPFKTDLGAELDANARELEWLASFGARVVVVPSNHNQHLTQWLEDGRYLKEPQNTAIGVELAKALHDGWEPYQYAMKERMDSKAYARVLWLQQDEAFELDGVECGQHGHAGANGSRGSVKSFERAYRRITIGHIHTPEILRECVVVGTSTRLRLNYTKGPSSWAHTVCVQHEGGARQLVNILDGQWTGLE